MKQANPASRFIFYEQGFHGDAYLMKLVETIVSKCQAFIETGSNVGSTLAYMAKKHANLLCLSCEPDREAYQAACQNADFPNALLFNETSPQLLLRIQLDYKELFPKNVLFWLDAHGYGYPWPLREEIAFISKHFEKGHILIDDFRVPHLPGFGFESYDGQECSLEFIKDQLNPRHDYLVYYPNYTERTSAHHPLRGWGLIEFGDFFKNDIINALGKNVLIIDTKFKPEGDR